MIKIFIKKLEKNLGYKIQRNITCFGIDTATHCGIAKIRIDNKMVLIDYSHFTLPSIPRKIANQMEKAEKYEQAMESAVQMIRNFKETMVLSGKTILVLEQSFLLYFGTRAVNPETFGYLRTLGGIYYAELYDSFDEIKIWLAIVARKITGFHTKYSRKPNKDMTSLQFKTLKKKEIMTWVSNIIGKEIKDDNEADALMLCFAGIKQ